MADTEAAGKPVVSPNYKGPTTSFPYKSFRYVGIIHIFLGLAALFISVIHLSLGTEHRDIFLQFAAAPLWCPIPVIVVGVLGVMVSRKRYWEVRCMKMWFGILSLINAFLFMVVMGSLVGFYGYWYYSVSTYEPAEADDELKMDENIGYTIVITLVLVIAGLEVLLGFVSLFLVCCCARVKRPHENPDKVIGTVPDRADNTIPKPPKSNKKQKIIIIQSDDPHAQTLAREHGIPRSMLPQNQPPASLYSSPPQASFLSSPHGNGMLPASFVTSASPAHTVHYGDEPVPSTSQSTEAPKKKKKKKEKKKKKTEQQPESVLQPTAPSAPDEPPPPFSPHAYAAPGYAPGYAAPAYGGDNVYGYASGPLGASGSLYPDLAAIQSGPSVVFHHSNIPYKQ